MPQLSEVSSPSYTIVTCHYGDLFWIRHLVERLGTLSDDRIQGIVVVDQSRETGETLRAIEGVTAVLDFAPDLDQIAVEGHDHPAALDNALQTWNFETSHVIVMDSDAFPTTADWLDRLENISLALVPGSSKQTHPCLMVFPVASIPHVNFSEGFLERAHRRGAPDTGRRVGAQLEASGETVTLLPAAPAFNGYRGSFYLDGAYYHHGHGSFFGGDHQQYRGFVSQASEQLYRDRILRGQFSLTPLDIAALFIRYVWRRVTNRIRLIASGPAPRGR